MLNEKPKKANDKKSSNNFFKNVFIVLLSNIFSIISGTLIGFVIPKLMGVSEYGYYKTFTLYCSYIGIFHFGFIDGIYLKYAGKKFDDLNKNRFRTYSKFLIFGETFVSLLVVITSLFYIKSSLFYILLFFGLNIMATNITTYFEFVSQITMQFKRITFRNVIRCTLNVVSICILFVLYKFYNVMIYYYYYAVVVVLINYILAVWYTISYRSIVFGQSDKFLEVKQDILSFFKIGVPLLLSNLIAQLIFVVDQQFVNIAFDNETYSIYAFSYNMISLITVATNAISTVLYPTLKTLNESTITKNYTKLNSYLLLFVSFGLILYYPLSIIVNVFLPDYLDSLNIFKIIFPGVVFSSSISVVKYNCYKNLGQISNYFIKSLIILCISIIADLVAYYCFRTTIAISIASILVLIIWYLLIDFYFIKKYKVSWIKNFVYALFIVSVFYGCLLMKNIYIGGIMYLSVFSIISCFAYKKEIVEIIQMICRRHKS